MSMVYQKVRRDFACTHLHQKPVPTDILPFQQFFNDVLDFSVVSWLAESTYPVI